MTAVVIKRKISQISVGRLQDAGVRLVTLDLDKVLSEHKALSVYRSAAVFVGKLQAAGIATVIVTNERNPQRTATIAGQLGGIPVMYAGLDGMRGKPFPDMLLAARRLAPEGAAVHIDDQFKAYICAQLAGFDACIWVYPHGNPLQQNIGVLMIRVIELPIVALIWLLQRLLAWNKSQ